MRTVPVFCAPVKISARRPHFSRAARAANAKGIRHSIPSYTVGLKLLAGRETYRRSITIPEAVSVGPAKYEVDLEFSCHLIHRMGWPIRLASPPVRFDVTPRPLISLPPLLGPPAQDGQRCKFTPSFH